MLYPRAITNRVSKMFTGRTTFVCAHNIALRKRLAATRPLNYICLHLSNRYMLLFTFAVNDVFWGVLGHSAVRLLNSAPFVCFASILHLKTSIHKWKRERPMLFLINRT